MRSDDAARNTCEAGAAIAAVCNPRREWPWRWRRQKNLVMAGNSGDPLNSLHLHVGGFVLVVRRMNMTLVDLFQFPKLGHFNYKLEWSGEASGM